MKLKKFTLGKPTGFNDKYQNLEYLEEIERLTRIEEKYTNLCNVLNEQSTEIKRLEKLVADSAKLETPNNCEIEGR